MKKQLFLILFFGSLSIWTVRAAEGVIEAEPDTFWLRHKWDAQWITCPDVPLSEYGVYHFRKDFSLAEQPGSFVINISADNRYRLFVNGRPVCWGPARGDLFHWYYETVDIAPLLKTGRNVLAVTVWNFGDMTPGAQITLKTGLIVQGNTAKEAVVNTDGSWKVYQNPAYAPYARHRQDVGCGDIVRGEAYPWGWERPEYDDSSWSNPRVLRQGQAYGAGSEYEWILTKRDIPLMEETQQRMIRIRRSENLAVSDPFLKGGKPLTVPAGQKVSFLIDQTFLTTAYPELHVSGGRGSSIQLTYSEALFNEKGKGNRNDIEGRNVVGFSDIFYPDGAENRLFRPLWFKTYRYIQVDIETAGEALVLNDMYGMYTGYPFRENGSFASDDLRIGSIWEVGWRTARLCAHETYFDCPYYEQLQYVGDTRIQALISLYVDGDDRLMKKAIRTFDWSRTFEGITASRYPARIPQYIPPFSLYWINMVHDYRMHREDARFVRSCLPGVKTVLEWFEDKIDPATGMLGAIPHWNFTDWAREWPWDSRDIPNGGVPPGAINGGSAILSLQLAYTLKDAIELFTEYNEPETAARYKRLYESLCRHTMERCWDEEKQMLSDDIARTSYSQHVNIMGILSDAVPPEKQPALFTLLDSDPSLIQATFYYRFYLFRALKKVGMANRYISMLQPWYDMLDIGLTTFAENPEPSRSDCHAWSSSPNYDLLATVCGVEPASPGFRTVRIAPHPGPLKKIKAQVPHPRGLIKIDLQFTSQGVKGSVTLPEGVPGTFVWGDLTAWLRAGENKLSFTK